MNRFPVHADCILLCESYVSNIFFLISGTTEAKKTDIADTFLDLGRNLFPDNLFQAAFQSVKTFSMILLAHCTVAFIDSREKNYFPLEETFYCFYPFSH